MSLKVVVDTLDSVPEQYRELYEQDGDGYRLAVEGVKPDSEVAGLVENRNALLREKKELAEKLKKLEGIDPDEYQALKEGKEASEREKLEKKGEWDKLKQQLLDKQNQALAAKEEEIGSLVSTVETLLIDNEATALLASDDLKGSPTLLLPHVRKRARVERAEDGTFQVVVLQKDGKTPLIDGSGNIASIKDLLSEMRNEADFGGAFHASGATGTGAKGSDKINRTTKGPKQIDASDHDAFLGNLEGIAAGEVEVM